VRGSDGDFCAFVLSEAKKFLIIFIQIFLINSLIFGTVLTGVAKRAPRKCNQITLLDGKVSRH
jgi:hypothetical protein